ncbi:expressed unknown protein [Seminavis robusta]|uniref:Uncharacterized protein n=1 Tax=Seminavis robusta TaxID=568900 RepID=A0A9N8EJP7_9STRA|nr:expressed unknown protein [Seminavis robusta]|eukprot:Sro1212_g252860.1 n/a (239) ;mRNA; r:2975-3800
MATASRQVQFQGIDSVFESQKTERGNRERKAHRERKKAKKMAERDAKEHLRYFVLFLQTYQIQRPGPPRPTLREMIQSVNGAMGILGLLFPDAADDTARLEAFDNIVTTRQLPLEDKSGLRAHIGELTVLMRLCQNQGIYTDLDRFYQELRHSDQLGTLDEYFAGLAPNNEEQFRQVLAQLRRHGLGLTRANDMPEVDRNGLRGFMDAHAAATRADQNALVSSSDESSADGDELRRLD